MSSFHDMAACIDVHAPEPPAPILSARPLLMRQICDSRWICGELYLRANPEASEITVYSHHWHEGSFWDYKVVRINHGNGEELERQTWLNNQLMSAYVYDEPEPVAEPVAEPAAEPAAAEPTATEPAAKTS